MVYGVGINLNNGKFNTLMASSILKIIIGLIVWKFMPGWITQGKKNVRDVSKMACNIIGIIMVLAGGYSLVMDLIGH